MNVRIWSAAAPILLLLSMSCSQGTQGILASIEREKKVHSAGGLNWAATVTHMAELSGNYYIAGGGALFQRAILDASGNQVVNWNSTTVASGYTNFMAVGRAGDATNGTLYAVGNRGATDSNALFSSTDGVTWTKVTLSGTEQATDLIPIRQSDGVSADKLLLVTKADSSDSPGKYQHVYIIDYTGTGTTEVTHIGTEIGLEGTGTATGTTYTYGYPVTSAAIDGTDYYFVNNNGVFYYNGSGNLATIVTGADMGSTGYYGVILLPTSVFTTLGSAPAVITKSSSALLWGSLSGGTWTELGKATGKEDASGSDVFFGNALLETATSPNYLWIGTLNSRSTAYAGAGIASVSPSLDYALQPPAGMDTDSYESTIQESNGQVVGLETAQIDLLFHASDGSIFAGTAAQGLWRWNPSTTSWSQQ